MMRFRPAGGLDLATVALILSGAGCVAAAIVVAVVLLAPPAAPESPSPVPPTPLPVGRPAAALAADSVATVLSVDDSVGAGGAARAGDRVDVLGYFSSQITGGGQGSVTRVLLSDVTVLGVDRSGSSVALTLAVPQQSALVLQEAQAVGARPFVTLRPVQAAGLATSAEPSSFSDADLSARVAQGVR